MGWSWYSNQHSPRGYEAEKREVERIYGNGGKNQIEQISRVGNVWYLAVLTFETETVWAGVCLTGRNEGSWGYKSLTEVQLPYYFDAPASLLKKLSATTDADAIKWRETCQKAIAEKKALKEKVANVRTILVNGMVVDTKGLFGTVKGVEIKSLHVTDISNRRFWSPDVGISYVLKPKQIKTMLQRVTQGV